MEPSLGDYLKAARQALGLSLRDAARRTNGAVSHTYLGDLERGNDRRTGKPLHPSPLVLRALADVYQVSYDELMQRAGYTFGARAPHVGLKGETDAVPQPGPDSLASVLASLLLERQRQDTLREEKEKIREEKEREAQANERLRIEKEYALRERELEAIRIPEQQRFNQVAEDLHQLVTQMMSSHAADLADESEAAGTSYGR